MTNTNSSTTVIARKPVAPLVIAATFDANNVTAALVSNESARPVATHVIALKQLTTRGVTAAITAACSALVEHPARAGAAIKAVSLAAPGQLDPRSGRITLPDWKGWTRVALAQQVERALGEAGVPVQCADAGEHTTANLPVYLHTSLMAKAAAESWTGAARGKSHVVYVELGDTANAAVLIGGRAFYGADGLAGAAGWLAINHEFKHEYESQGCLNAEAGKSALVRRALEEYGGDASSMLGSLIMNSPQELTPEMILRSARGGEALAQKAITENCRALGRGLANFIAAFNPEAVVLGGELARGLLSFFDVIREEASLWSSPETFSTCRIALAKLPAETVALQGAARLAWRQLEDK